MIDKTTLKPLSLALFNMLELLEKINPEITDVDSETLEDNISKIKVLYNESLEHIKAEVCKRKEKYDRMNDYINKYILDPNADFITVKNHYSKDVKGCENILKHIKNIPNIIITEDIDYLYDHVNDIFLECDINGI